MIPLFEGFHKHVINIHLHHLSEVLGEHTVDESFVSCASILKAERHYPIAVGSSVSYECGFFLVVGVHHDLIVPGERVHEG